MGQNQELAEIFERERPRLQRIARRVLSDWDEAEEAVQETWLKTDKVPQDELRSAGAWLTTIVTRVCLDRLRHRRRRVASRTIELDDPANEKEVADVVGDGGPEHAALMADAVGVALLVILERLPPWREWHSCSMTCSTCPSMRSLP